MNTHTTAFKCAITFVYLVVILTFIGLPAAFIAFGSDANTQPNPLYPQRSSVFVSDDFISGLNTNGTTGVLGWIVNGGVTTNLASIAGRPGLLRKDTSAVSGTIATLFTSGTGSVWDSSSNHILLILARLNSNDANTTVRIGLSNAFASSPSTDGIYFEKLDADTNWFCVTRSASVQTRTDSGIAVNTNFNAFEYKRDSSGVAFFLNYAQVCSQSTNIPAIQGSSGLHIVNSAAAVKSIDIDYFSMIVTGLSR